MGGKLGGCEGRAGLRGRADVRMDVDCLQRVADRGDKSLLAWRGEMSLSLR